MAASRDADADSNNGPEGSDMMNNGVHVRILKGGSSQEENGHGPGKKSYEDDDE